MAHLVSLQPKRVPLPRLASTRRCIRQRTTNRHFQQVECLPRSRARFRSAHRAWCRTVATGNRGGVGPGARLLVHVRPLRAPRGSPGLNRPSHCRCAGFKAPCAATVAGAHARPRQAALPASASGWAGCKRACGAPSGPWLMLRPRGRRLPPRVIASFSASGSKRCDCALGTRRAAVAPERCGRPLTRMPSSAR